MCSQLTGRDGLTVHLSVSSSGSAYSTLDVMTPSFILRERIVYFSLMGDPTVKLSGITVASLPHLLQWEVLQGKGQFFPGISLHQHTWTFSLEPSLGCLREK